MLSKILSAGLTGLFGLGLAAAFQPPEPPDGPPPPRSVKKKGEPPADPLRKAYDLLRRVCNDNRTTGRPEERLRDWTDRATALYRQAVSAEKDRDREQAHEYGMAAHDLARAVDLARSAAQFDQSGPDPDLPPPPGPGPGPASPRERVAGDLRRAYDHIRDQLDRDDPGKDAKFYNDASRDLYNAARRDAEAGRYERATELAHAAEAMSHVTEHVARASGLRSSPPDDDRPEPKKKAKEKEKEKEKEKSKLKKKAGTKGEPPEPKKRRGPEADDDRPEPKGEGRGNELPPPI